jgi:prepilin-type N-terminal cleavage/methylation domain-containing protein
MSNFLNNFLHYSNLKNRKKGMTLFELLVVLLIIGILAAIAWLSLIKVADKFREVQAIQDIRYLMVLQSEYYHEEKSFICHVKAPCSDSQTIRENYFYKIMLLPPDNKTIAAHFALSKKPNLRSYVGALYLENNEVKMCKPFSIPDDPILPRYPITEQKLVDLYYSKSNLEWASFCK